jgi:exodeoxyribonuclease-3
MKLCSWNVNGIRAASEKGLFAWMQSEQPDLLCLQETKLQEANLRPEFTEIESYYDYWNHAEKKGYSGTVTYSRAQPVAVRYGLGVERFNTEGRVVETEFPEFTLFNIYFPNGQQSEERLRFKLDFYDAALECFNRRRAMGKSVVICGDYNTAHQAIDLKNPKQNENYSGFLPVERAWLDRLNREGYLDTYRMLHPEEIKYSWWSYRFQSRSKNIGWRIDYFFVSDDLKAKIKSAEILTDVTGSDHCPILLELDF